MLKDILNKKDKFLSEEERVSLIYYVDGTVNEMIKMESKTGTELVFMTGIKAKILGNNLARELTESMHKIALYSGISYGK